MILGCRYHDRLGSSLQPSYPSVYSIILVNPTILSLTGANFPNGQAKASARPDGPIGSSEAACQRPSGSANEVAWFVVVPVLFVHGEIGKRMKGPKPIDRPLPTSGREMTDVIGIESADCIGEY